MIQPIKVGDMVLIKDIHNPSSSTRGIGIPNLVRGAPASDIPVFDVTASLSSVPLTSLHSQPLVLNSYKLILASQLEDIM